MTNVDSEKVTEENRLRAIFVQRAQEWRLDPRVTVDLINLVSAEFDPLAQLYEEANRQYLRMPGIREFIGLVGKNLIACIPEGLFSQERRSSIVDQNVKDWVRGQTALAQTAFLQETINYLEGLEPERLHEYQSVLSVLQEHTSQPELNK
ncbi:hypothetical protein A3A66_04310 [Microgenomates group bacterium RIFCSPLOWO2_01_FULL_46_13]|nr:MAG: hypothetical protein A2783_04255 [Microgenomates group bacterium RIFCSPHIGHO2_01_FULL_45_11]OGV94200.1 MAG: hypothetical protein A3A66_04310 [Microgenomates group bacterium RIFCSPLOWO2_01_FULL_46_13]